MADSRLGRGRNSPRRRWLWEEGRIKAARALFTKSPSTVPILTIEFFMAERRRVSRLELPHDVVRELFETRLLLAAVPLCKLHRNEPGWFVGEHIHVLLGGAGPAGEKEIARFGALCRFMEKLSEGVL